MAVPEAGKCAPYLRMYKGKYPLTLSLYSSNPVTVDWFVLGQCGKSGTSTKFSRHFYLLSRPYIPSHSSRWKLYRSRSPPAPPTFLSRAHSHHLPSYLGKCLLVYEPNHQPYMCTISNTAATVSEAIPPSDRDTVQPSEAGTNSRVLCRRTRKTVLPMGIRGTPSPSRICLPGLPISLFENNHTVFASCLMCRG